MYIFNVFDCFLNLYWENNYKVHFLVVIRVEILRPCRQGSLFYYNPSLYYYQTVPECPIRTSIFLSGIFNALTNAYRLLHFSKHIPRLMNTQQALKSKTLEKLFTDIWTSNTNSSALPAHIFFA